MSSLHSSKLKYKYFLSAADQDMYEDYYTGLSSALKKYNVDGVILSTVEHIYEEDTYVLLAQDKNKKNLGGIRIEIKSHKNSLPLEKSDIPQKKLLDLKIKRILEEGKTIAEVCGMWVDNTARDKSGVGLLGPRLSAEATQLAMGLGVDVLVAIVPTHTLGFTLGIGYEPDPLMSNMAYPDDRYLSTVIWNYNTQLVETKLAEPVYFLGANNG